jgi:protoporphyrin/coproporphyrin ferrochelatase
MISEKPHAPVGVLLMAHGTPSSLDQMAEYLTLVRGGRPPSAELVEEMRHNYATIGGRSPLTDITLAQAAALQARLGFEYLVTTGMRNWHPFIAEAVATLEAAGARQIVGIPLAPQFSTLSVQKYIDAATRVMPEGVTFSCVRSYHVNPRLVDAFAARLREAAPTADERIVFTAHSLPVRVIEAGDPYAEQVAATAAAVAAAAGIPDYDRAYQSAGRTPEPWLGPDLSDYVRDRAAEGTRAFLVAPIGFVCDHTEVLFDIDVQAAQTASACGVHLRRTASLNTSPLFIEALADLVFEEVGQQSM